jgi:hypothetical protein
MPSTYNPISDRKAYTAKEIKSSSQRNTIQLLAKDVEIAGVNTGAKHYYYLYTNNSGKQYYASAYPEKEQAFNWGRIVHKTGEYKPGTPDHKDSIRVGVISGSAAEVNQTFQNMQSQFKKIDNSNIPYGGTNNNSNSAAITVLYSSGIQFGRNSLGGNSPGSGFDVNAPGQETDLSKQLTSSSVTDKATTVADNNNSETRQHTATNSAKAAELVARVKNSNNPIGEPSNNSKFAQNLAKRATSTKPINSDGLQDQKSTPSTTGAVADNKKVQQRGISRQ